MKGKFFVSIITLFLILLIFVVGCMSERSEGDTGKSPSSSTDISPSTHDYGIVTLGNSPIPCEIKIINNQSKSLAVSGIVLSDKNNFRINLGGGSNPCNSPSPTINSDEYCTIEVFFEPLSTASYSANLRIVMDDEKFPELRVQLTGVNEPLTDLIVRINQTDSNLNCPAALVTAYVSVTDQGGYSVTGLLKSDFLAYEGLNMMNLTDLSFVSQITTPISVVLAMDYSGSTTTDQELKSDMENSAAYFINQLGTNDEAEIIKFSGLVKVVQEFTSDKTLLTNSIYELADLPKWTKFYDAALKAIDDTSYRLNNRKAVIIISDGVDLGSDGIPLSSSSLNDVIKHANDEGIPIFIIGIGNINEAVLTKMSKETGGQFFISATSENLRNIYSQIVKVLFRDQYILTYESALNVNVSRNLTIEAVASPGVLGEDRKEITPCP